MKTILFSFILLISMGSFAFAGEYDEVLSQFYGSISRGCITAMDKSEASTNYCNCAASSFKKKFTKADETNLINFAKSVAAKPADKRQELMVEYVSSGPMMEKLSAAASECVQFILPGLQ